MYTLIFENRKNQDQYYKLGIIIRKLLYYTVIR